MSVPEYAPKAKKPRTKGQQALSSWWRTIRRPLADSDLTKSVVASALAWVLRLVKATNPPVAGSHDVAASFRANANSIYVMWHGQHIMCSALNTPDHRLAAMFSRSADAEINALVAERFGIETVRGSGGRKGKNLVDKGGARALIALKKALDRGSSVAMIADIAHGAPRQSGLGVITLARLSGRPIVPFAYTSSRRRVLEKSWDKTTLNLPFGRSAAIFGSPIFVPADAGETAMEEKRREVTAALNAATAEAYRLVDRRP
jgi:lysophospholipid acyltransferase (LPLAT)-like uncharacterized protein